MALDFQIFDAARQPLTKGVSLVEASAGTGKTYAITMLVLRAVVELQLPLEKILVVTFTKAATEELKSRIRSRLLEARDLLSGNLALRGGTVDQTLADWADNVTEVQAAIDSLQLALYEIDQAGVFTIHGFCQRMLSEQALESGQQFELELLADVGQVRREVVDDFWRSHIYPLDPVLCSILTGRFGSPEELAASVAAVFGSGGRIVPRAGAIDEAVERVASAIAAMKKWWGEFQHRLYASFVAAMAEEMFKKEFRDGFDQWFGQVSHFFAGERTSLPERIRLLDRQELITMLNGNRLRGETKKLAYLKSWTLPDEKIGELVQAMTHLLLTFRVTLAEQLRSEVSRRLLEQNNMGFDDLIHQLSAALQQDRGAALRQLLGERFSFALIDEFQDTDSDQWQIFSTLFAGGNHYLYLIGDPKQSIYKFRGADIHSYFLARKAADCLLTLEKNYRSHPLLVAEINRLFESRDNPFFFDAKTLAYHKVDPARRASEIDLLRDGQSLAGMVYCSLVANPEDKNGRWSSTKAAAALREFIVAELGRLLDQVHPVLLQSTPDGQQARALEPQDIAILVRSNRQAEQYQQALCQAAIPAVTGSRQSVFHSRQCRELVLLLQAIAAPGETSKLKAAMTISWFGLTGDQLYLIWQDEQQLDSYHRRFFQYNQLWLQQGFLPMMARLLVDENVLPTLALGQMAERTIVNIEHLLELVQNQETSEKLGAAQLLQWLLKMMQDDRGGEDGELLLESDEQAVRIVTMHSAKGLEYPVVFCPYLWYVSNRTKTEKYQVRCHDQNHQLLVDLGSDQFARHREQACSEEMAEELRLLYVALTRAKIRCYAAWADVKAYGPVGDCSQSAFGYMLFPHGVGDFSEQQHNFTVLAQERAVHHQVVGLEQLAADRSSADHRLSLQPLPFSGRTLNTDWGLSSFSALASISEYDHEAAPRQTLGGRPAQLQAITVPGLPVGPNFGNAIHDLLETIPFAAFRSLGRESGAAVLEEIARTCARYGLEAAPEEVLRLLELVVTTPLGAEEFTLAMLQESQCIKETGFYFHLGRLASDQVNSILAKEPTFAPLGHREMRGYLTGFVDLICEFDGKFYILDYKTNYLGDLLENYANDNLVTAMRSHNYGLQYWIYSLVLHRHLQNMLPEYQYVRHFGGVKYLFVRGMSPTLPGSGIFSVLPAYHTLQALDMAMGGGEDDQPGF